MKVRKLAVALALVGSLGAEMAHAVGLGNLDLESNLNEPLKAEINLLSVGDLSADELVVNLAPKSDFERAGLERTYNLTNLKFKVVRNAKGKLVVSVTTNQPVREPYLDFLVQLVWPSGRLLREYAVLVDPPTYSEGQSQPVTTAASGASASDSAGNAAKQSQAAPASNSVSSASGQGQAGIGGTYGPTKASDTLWSIAEQARPSNAVTTQQVMLAIQDLNPDAFIGDNINRMKKGQVLRLPGMDQIQSRSPHQAVAQVTGQNRAFRADQNPAINGTNAGPENGTAAAQPAGDELKLSVASDGKKTTEGSHGGGIGGSGEGSVQDKLAVTAEQLDKTKRDNAELNSRVQDLQDQIKTLQRLVALKNDQLASLQDQTLKQDQTQTQGADQGQLQQGQGQQGQGEQGQADQSQSLQGQAQQGAGQGSAASTDENASGQIGAAGEQAASPVTGTETQQGAVADTTGAQTGSANTADGETSMANPAAEPAGTEAASGTSDQATANAEPDSTEQASGPTAPPEAQSATQNADQKPSASAPTTGVNTAAKPTTTSDQAPASVTDQVIQQLLNNPLYQLAAGGVGILLLIGLWLLARRNAHRERSFYEQLREVEGNESPADPTGAEHEDDTLAALAAAGALEADDDHKERGVRQDADESVSWGEQEVDTLAEADGYIAYGRYDTAIQLLENAISSEPSRADLRLKLLEAYAESGQGEGFDRQFSELEAIGDEQAIAAAQAMRGRLQENEDMPSISDLESELKGSSLSDAGQRSSHEQDAILGAALPDQAEDDEGDLGISWDLSEAAAEDEPAPSAPAETPAEAEPESYEADNSIDFDIADLELDEGDDLEAASEEDAAGTLELDDSLDFEHGEVGVAAEEVEDALAGTADEDLNFTLETVEQETEEPEPLMSDAELAELGYGEESEAHSEEDILPSMASEQSESDVAEPAQPAADIAEAEAEGEGKASGAPIDESFLDELDAELDKVTGPESEEAPEVAAPLTTPVESEPAPLADDLDDLELDVSDDDLAILEEAAGGQDLENLDLASLEDVVEDDQAAGPIESAADADSAEPEVPAVDTADDAHRAEDDALLDIDLDESEETLTEASQGLSEDEWSDIDFSEDPFAEETSDTAPGETGDIDDSILEDAAAEAGLTVDSSGEDDDDFDFLAGTDEAATKLDLARAYIEMGDAEGARDILEEVALEGNDSQKVEAQGLLKNLS